MGDELDSPILMQTVKDCPLCGKDVLSDATLKEYCALCGMGIQEENFIVKKFRQMSKYFCCELCYGNYLKVHLNKNSM